MENPQNFWYLENIDLNKLLCPVKVAKADKPHGQDYKKGDFIYLPDTPSEKLYFIDNGRIKIGTYSPEGKEIIKAILRPGEIFGLLSMISEENHNDFAQAMDDDVHLCERSFDEVKGLLKSDMSFVLYITKILGKKLMKTENRLQSLIFKDAKTRIVEFLAELGRDHGKQVGLETLVQNFYTHQEIANLTGTSRQTVTTVLNKLREENKIYFDRKRLLIRDLHALA